MKPLILVSTFATIRICFETNEENLRYHKKRGVTNKLDFNKR